MNIYLGLFLSLISGVLLALSGFWSGIFAWIALVPIGIVLERADQKLSGVYGFITGISAAALLFHAVSAYGFKYYIVLVIYDGLQGALTAAAYVVLLKKAKNLAAAIFVPPLTWIVFEYLKTVGIISFPMSLGASQYHFLPFLQFASIAGVYGLSLIILWVNRVLVAWAIEFFFPEERRLKHTKFLRQLAIVSTAVCFIFAAIVCWGHYVLAKNPIEDPEIKVSIIQGSIPLNFYDRQVSDERIKKLISDSYFDLTEEALREQRPDVLLWPEGAIYDMVMEIESYKTRILDYARKYDSFMMVGTPARNEAGAIVNSAYVITDEGKIAGRYDKVRIVPFVENYGRGEGYLPIMTKYGSFGIVLCFESLYPQALRKMTSRGAEVLFSLTNDCGLEGSMLIWMHANDTRIRAVENRRYTVRADQYGVSLIIDPFGRVLKKYDGRNKNILNGTINRRKDKTLYTRFGDYIPIACFLICIIAAIRQKDR